MTAKLHFVKKARKTYRGTGVKKGDSYFWFRFCTRGMWGPIRRSLTKPRRSALTRSAFTGAIWDAEDDVEEARRAFAEGKIDADGIADALTTAANTVRELGEEASSSRDNMPEQLQDSDSGQLLEARAKACERIASELESAADKARDMPEVIDYGDEQRDGEFEWETSERDELISEIESIDWSVE